MKLTNLFLMEKRNVKYDFSAVLCILPDSLANSVIEWSRENIDNEDLYEDEEGGKGRENEPHVTVKYGLHTKSPEEIEKILNDFSQFDINLGKISLFKKDTFDVVKIEVFSEALRDVNARLSELKNSDEFEGKYNPHVTIAYVKHDSCDGLAGLTPFKKLKFEAKKLVFNSADGKSTEIKLKD